MQTTHSNESEFAEILLILRQLLTATTEHQRTTKIVIYTVADVAQILRCKENTIRNLLFRSKELPYFLAGREIRIRHEDVLTFVANRVESCVYTKVLP